MKKKFLFAALIVLTIVTGCIFSEDNKKEDSNNNIDNTAPNETAEKYYPMKVGAHWTYEATVSKINASDTTYTDIYEITDIVIHNEMTYFVEKRDIGGYGELFMYLRTEGNILYGVDLNKGSEELSYLNFGLSIGDSWNPTGTVFEETFDGIVEEKVPAGTFSNCMKFRAVGYVIENDTLFINEIKEYYAPGVGRVKCIFIKTNIDGEVVFSEITDLTSYIIPE